MSQEPTRSRKRAKSPLRERRVRERSSQPGRMAAWATGLALLFLFITLLALVLVPMRLEQDVEVVREQLATVFDPVLVQGQAVAGTVDDPDDLFPHAAVPVKPDARQNVFYRRRVAMLTVEWPD